MSLEHLQQLEALRHHPALQVSPGQRPAIVGNILHYLMRPYFLKRTPVMQEKFGEAQYQTFNRGMAEYCLREYVESSEPRLTVAFIKGLHRQFYGNAVSVSVKAIDGSMVAMVPGEFKTRPVFMRRSDHSSNEWFDSTAPEHVAREMDKLLGLLHDDQIPLLHRYLQFVFDLMLIHPFLDSNGKVAMLLGDIFLLRQGVLPPYIAKHRSENMQESNELRQRYTLDQYRDISIYYPVLIKMYEDLLVAHPASAAV